VTRRGPTLAVALAFALSSVFARRAAARKIDRWTAVHTALKQNPQIAAARAEEDALRAQQRQVTAAHWPFVALSLGVGPSDKATLVPGTSVTSVQQQYKDFTWTELSAVFFGNLTVIQPIYTFGKIAHRGEAADHGLRAREAQTRMQSADVAFEVAQLYEGMLFARDAGRFFEEMKSWLEKMLQQTQEMVAKKVGHANERDILRIQAAMGMADLGIHEARAGEAEARAGLIAYLGYSQSDVLEPAEDELAPVGPIPGDLDQLVRTARENRPELVALREGERGLAALARAEHAGLWPNILALGILDVAYTPGRDWIETRFVVDPLNHFVPGLLVGLRWELQGAMAPARAAEQRAHANVLLHLGEWASDGIPAEVRKSYEDAARAQKDIDSVATAVKKAKEWMVGASMDYNVGLLDVREVADAVSSYVTLRTAQIRARFQYNCAMAGLSKAVGDLDKNAEIYPGQPGHEQPGHERGAP
jgi:outer membrane protein TolC